MTEVLMPLASAVTLETSPDGKQTGVFFKVPGDPGFIGVALASNELSRLAELIIDQAGRLHFMHYNFVRIHKTLRVTPAMAAGVTTKLWDIADIVQVVEDWESEA